MPKITFTGDIMCYPRITDVAKGDYTPIFSLAENLSNCDYLVGNLETPIAGEDLEYTHERYCFNTPIGFLEAIKSAGFNLLSLANNHCMDRGEEGIIRTLENCRKYGFDTIGVYKTEEERNSVFIKEINGINYSQIPLWKILQIYV